jgi:NAD+ kinase
VFNEIVVAYSEKISRNHVDTVSKVSEMLTGRDVKIVKSRELDESCFSGADLVITIGGDGAVIRAAAFVRDCPLLGINSEPEMSEGALTGIMDRGLDFLKDVFKGDFQTLKRQRAEVVLNGRVLEHPALNEVYVGAESQFHTSRYIIRHKNDEEEQRSSGVLIATGSGSNAWYMAAGGVPFGCGEEKLKFVVREPFRGRLFKARITGGEILKGESVAFESKRDEGGIIALDANIVHCFNCGDKALVRLSGKPLETIVKKTASSSGEVPV